MKTMLLLSLVATKRCYGGGGGVLCHVLIIALCLLTLLPFNSGAQMLGISAAAAAAAANHQAASALNARIQCEYRDKDGDSLVLNCTLVTGLLQGTIDSSVIAGVLVNSLEQGISSQNPQSSSSSNLNIRVGMERHWRTPWESLSINHNIIRTVIWRNSRLSEIGDYAFKDLNSIQRLDLSFNRLSQLNATSLSNLEVDLIDLDLSHNLFQQIPVDLFEQNKRVQSLETLRLNENPILIIPRRPFETLKTSLRVLELNYCQIRAIELNAFEGMRQLESVSLIGNHLRHLQQSTFADLNLRSFYVHENPLVCDCHMRWLIDYLKIVDYQQQTYESQLAILSTTKRFSLIGNNVINSNNNNENGNNLKQQPFSSFTYIGSMSVAGAAQTSLKCDQPNSLKSKPNFLDINPDSFMCDIQLAFRDRVNESTYELGEDAVLICDVYGDPEPDVYWSFGQKPIEKALSNELDKYDVSEIRGLLGNDRFGKARYQQQQHLTNKTSELRIRDLQASDMGLYTCTAEIKGSNNRKQIVFSVKQVKGATTSLSNAGDIFLAGFNTLASQFFNYIYNLGNSNPNKYHQIYYSNSTLLLLFSILVALFLFLCIICFFICWKLKCCCCRHRSINSKKRRLAKANKLLSVDDMTIGRKEQEKLLISAPNGRDHLDHHHHHNHHHNNHPSLNYANLADDSSATLLSTANTNQKNSIRMAYPNYALNNQMNDIYANHSLLTTTSSTTGSSYPAMMNGGPAQTIAIDTSNHTPRYHLLQQQQQQQMQIMQQQDCYYDDLRYNGDEMPNRISPNMNPSNIYSSPYRNNPNHHLNQQHPQSYSPIIRRDDPTVPLYATLKPKQLMQHHQQLQQQQQHQQQLSRNYNNYVQYSTIHRSQLTPVAKPRQFLPNYHHQLPPPPPPPPIPPIKPKRTFEYVIGQQNREQLHSESGAFLLGDNDTNTTPSINENEFQNYQSHLNGLNMNLIKQKIKQKNKKKLKHQQIHGSTTSLDEEDLDLNDLKDFEDVTFDNLRKPGEDKGQQNHQQPPHQQQQQQQSQQNTIVEQKPVDSVAKSFKTTLSIKMQDLKDTNSEQSLLLKSSSSSESKSSSDNTINNICGASNSTNTSSTNTSSELRSNSDLNRMIDRPVITDPTGKLENNLMENVVDELNSKIYEETEI